MRLSTWAKNNGIDHDAAAVVAHANMILDRELSFNSNLDDSEIKELDSYELPEVADPETEEDEELIEAELIETELAEAEPVDPNTKLSAGERIKRGLTQAVLRKYKVSSSSSQHRSKEVEATDETDAIRLYCLKSGIAKPSSFRFRAELV